MESVGRIHIISYPIPLQLNLNPFLIYPSSIYLYYQQYRPLSQRKISIVFAEISIRFDLIWFDLILRIIHHQSTAHRKRICGLSINKCIYAALAVCDSVVVSDKNIFAGPFYPILFYRHFSGLNSIEFNDFVCFFFFFHNMEIW